MDDLLLAVQFLLSRDFMFFYERCFELLEPGTPFVDNWHLHAVAEALRKVRSGKTKRLIINVPPRSGKSLMVTIAFTAWLLGHNPRLRIICVSYSEDLAKTHAVAFRAVVRSDWYRAAFPAFQIARDRGVETTTTARGYRYAVSIGGPVLGRGADLVVADDAMSPQASLSSAVRERELALWNTAHRTRLNQQAEGAMILVSQRLHQDDLVGHALKAGNWDRLVLAAIAPASASYRIGPMSRDVYHRAADEVLQPAREPRNVLDDLRLDLGSMIFAAMYQQDPVPPSGNIIKRDDICFYDQAPGTFERLVASWDTASTISDASSYSVGMLWGAVGTNYYLLDLVRGRWEAPDLRRRIIDTERDWCPDATLIEDGDVGRSLTQDLRRTTRMRPLLRKPRFSKEARLLAQSARFEAKQVHLPRQASWLAELVSELLAFPNGSHDDQVDATSQALDYLTGQTSLLQPMERRNINRRNIVRRGAQGSS